jgi:hypothetical protein
MNRAQDSATLCAAICGKIAPSWCAVVDHRVAALRSMLRPGQVAVYLWESIRMKSTSQLMSPYFVLTGIFSTGNFVTQNHSYFFALFLRESIKSILCEF